MTKNTREIKHGTVDGFRRRCRCEACTQANSRRGKYQAPAFTLVQSDQEMKDERLLQALQKRFTASGAIRTIPLKKE